MTYHDDEAVEGRPRPTAAASSAESTARRRPTARRRHATYAGAADAGSRNGGEVDTAPERTRLAPTRAAAPFSGQRHATLRSAAAPARYAPVPAGARSGWFDEVADELADALVERGIPRGAVQQITIDRGEITFYVQRDRVLELCRTLRDDEGLRFELCSSVSGVDYGEEVEQRLHVVYHLLSMTYRRRIRLEVALDVDDPHVPSVVEVYPTAPVTRGYRDMFGGLRGLRLSPGS